MDIQQPYKISNVDFDNIVYPNVKTNQNKKIILIKYNENNKLKNFVFQTPTLLNLYKINNENNYAELEIALVGKDKNKVKTFVDFLNKLENKIKTDVQHHASLWFSNTNMETIKCQKIIRESDKYKEGTIKIKIIKNVDFETSIRLNNNKKISLEQINENDWCKMILECYAIWINENNDFGLFFRPVIISFTPNEQYNYNFIDSEEESIDIPDTDINNNIFLNITSTNNNKYNDSTSLLDVNQLVSELNTINSNNINLKINEILSKTDSESDSEIESQSLNSLNSDSNI